MKKCPGKGTLGLLAVTAGYPKRGRQSIHKHDSQEFRNWGRAQEKEAGIEWSCELEEAETVCMDIRNAFLELAGVRIR
jgi:hypothetical protein